MKELMGDIIEGADENDEAVLPMYISRYRKESFRNFYRENDCVGYLTFDIPVIVHQCLDMWDGVKLSNMDLDMILH